MSLGLMILLKKHIKDTKTLFGKNKNGGKMNKEKLIKRLTGKIFAIKRSLKDRDKAIFDDSDESFYCKEFDYDCDELAIEIISIIEEMINVKLNKEEK